jgi:hypothetical protein
MAPKQAAKAPKPKKGSTTYSSLVDALVSQMTVDVFGNIIDKTHLCLRSTGVRRPAGGTEDWLFAAIDGLCDP